METKELGSKEWFKEQPMKVGGVYPETWDQKTLDSFNSDEKVENAHIAYNSVTKSVTECYIYRRKEVDIPAAEYLEKLEGVPEIIWLSYLEQIMPLLEAGTLEVISAPKVLLDTPPPLLSNSTELYNAFVSAFPEDLDVDKSNFIWKIQQINSNASSKRELFHATCKEFGKNFLEKTLPKTDENEDDFTYKDLLKNISSHVTKVKYFGISLDLSSEGINLASDILTDGRIYQLPNATHSWLNNLSWMLAHIHKGNSFIIFSPLTEDVMRRISEGYLGNLSGFAREIALLTKLNYQFILNDSTLILLPPVDKSEIENLHVKQAYMSDEEVVKYYMIAVEHFNKIANKKEEKSTQVTETISNYPSSPSKQSDYSATSFSYSPSPISQSTGGGSSQKRTLEKEEKEEKAPKKPKSGEGGGQFPPPTSF